MPTTCMTSVGDGLSFEMSVCLSDCVFQSESGNCLGNPAEICQKLRLKTYDFKFHVSPQEEEDPSVSSGDDSQSVCLTDKVLSVVKLLQDCDAESSVDGDPFDLDQFERIEIDEEEFLLQSNEACFCSLSKYGKEFSYSPNLALSGAMSPGCSCPVQLASATSAINSSAPDDPR